MLAGVEVLCAVMLPLFIRINQGAKIAADLERQTRIVCVGLDKGVCRTADHRIGSDFKEAVGTHLLNVVAKVDLAQLIAVEENKISNVINQIRDRDFSQALVAGKYTVAQLP